jgi:hypothetical protein
MASKMEGLAPLVAALPEQPSELPFTEANWTTLLAIMDTVIPSIRRETQATDKSTQLSISDVQYNTTVTYLKNTITNPPDSESLDEYLDEKPSDNPRFRELLQRTFMSYVKDDAKKGLGFILATLK